MGSTVIKKKNRIKFIHLTVITSIDDIIPE